MNGWKVRKSLWPYLDKLEAKGIFGIDRDEVVNWCVAYAVTHMIDLGVIDAKVKKPKRWFHRLLRSRVI